MYEGSTLLADRSIACFQKSLQPLAMIFTIGALCYVLSTPYQWSDTSKPSHAYGVFSGLLAAGAFVAMMVAYFSSYNEGWAWRGEAHTNPTLYGVFGSPDFSLNGDVDIGSDDFYSSDSSAVELETVKVTITFENLGF